MAMSHLTPRPKLFYGWWVVASLCAIMFLSTGLGFYSIGVFVKPFEEEFGWSRGTISVAMALSGVASGLFGPVVGVLVGRVGARLVIGVGALMMGVCFALLGLTWSLLYLYIMFTAMAVWRAGTMLVPVSAVVANWFQRQRGLAIGLTTTGIGLGGLVMAPLTAVLISAVGWRGTFFIMGALIALVGVPLSVFVIRQHPADRGLLPDGLPPDSPAAGRPQVSVPTEVDGWSLHDSVPTVAFFSVATAFSLAFATLGAVLLHIVPFLEDRGLSREEAGMMLGLVAGVGVLGKVASGYLADRTSPRVIAASVFLLQAVGLTILVETEDMVGVAAFTIIFGCSMGAVVALQPLMVVYCFGMASVATILGAMIAVTSVFNALGPVLAGFVYDAAGTYRPIFLVYVGIDCLAAAIVYFLGRPPLPVERMIERSPQRVSG